MSVADAAFAELVTLTGVTEAEWRDILTLPPAGQRIAIDAYRSATWVRNEDQLPKVLAVLGLLGTIIGFAGGAAGAISALRSL